MKKQDFIKLVERYAFGRCTSAEEKAVEAFFDKLQEKSLDEEWNEDELRRLRILYGIRKRVGSGRDVANASASLRWYRVAGIAAALVVLLGFALFYYPGYEEVSYVEETAMRGERREINLQDGSVIYLNAESFVKFPEKFSGTREVQLTGEAFFTVAKDAERPFIVKTGDLETRVLGTSFNVNAYPDRDIRISVNTGKVQVSSGMGEPEEKVFLVKNQQLLYKKDTGEFVMSAGDAGKYNAWTDNVMVMENNTLREVADMLEKWYDVEISIDGPDLESKVITGKYRTKSIKEILESIKFLKRVDYEFTGQRTIRITEMSNQQKP